MALKVLVAYATRAGSTMEIAQSIGRIFIDAGYETDTLGIKKVRSLEQYDAAILGTAVHTGMLMPEMVRFVRKNRMVLCRMSVAAFAVCLSMKPQTPEHHAAAKEFLDPVRREISLVSEGFFAGVMDYSRVGFIARFIVKNMVQTPEGDFREWDAINGWTRDLTERLKPLVIAQKSPS